MDADEQRQGGPGAAARGPRTRQLILDTALRLFREQSYDATTMRGIARAAGVSVGNAYHYFSGKEELVQAFYQEIQEEHRRRSRPVLARSADFAARLAAVLHTGVDIMTPYHGFAARFVAVAADPASPASPFSSPSTEAREAAIGLFREVVDGSRLTVAPALRAQLPELLWLAYLGVTLFWVHDRSPGQARTRALVDRVAPLAGRLLALSRLPGFRSVAADVVDLVRGARG